MWRNPALEELIADLRNPNASVLFSSGGPTKTASALDYTVDYDAGLFISNALNKTVALLKTDLPPPSVAMAREPVVDTSVLNTAIMVAQGTRLPYLQTIRASGSLHTFVFAHNLYSVTRDMHAALVEAQSGEQVLTLDLYILRKATGTQVFQMLVQRDGYLDDTQYTTASSQGALSRNFRATNLLRYYAKYRGKDHLATVFGTVALVLTTRT